MAKPSFENSHTRLSLTLPAPLAARLDDMVLEIREQNPLRSVTRSGLVQHLLAEHIALLDDPERAPSPRHRERQP